MTTQPPIYVINMAKDVARMESMARQLESQGLIYERVEAVAGRDLTAEQRKAVYSDFWFRIFHGRSATINELGCTLSHHKAWQLMLQREQDWAIFFEDDAAVDANFNRKLAVFEIATRSFDVVQFHSFRQPSILISQDAKNGFAVMRFADTNASAVAYGLRLSGASKLLRQKRVVMNADKWVWARALWGVKVCAIFPFPVLPHQELSAVSTIENMQSESRKNNRFWRIFVLPLLRPLRFLLIKVRGV